MSENLNTELTSAWQKRTAWTALHRGDYELYQNLKNDGHQFDWRDDCGRYPLHVAMHGGNTKIIKDLLDHFKHNINAVDFNGETPILAGVSYQNLDAIKLLKDRGADLTVTPRFTNGFADRVKAYGLKV